MLSSYLRTLLYTCAITLSTGLGVGFAPKAPGTWGSLFGLGLVFLATFGVSWPELTSTPGVFEFGPFIQTPLTTVFASVAALALGYGSTVLTQRAWRVHDDKRIVVDEILGQWLPFLVVPFTLETALLGFVFFRILDIQKPGFIGWLDRNLHGAWGVIADDLAAGVCCIPFLLVFAWTYFPHA